MRPVTGPAGPCAAPARAPRAELRKLAQDLEGVFLAQLFQAMRASVPQGGVLAPAPGQEMFTQILDERVARDAAKRADHGLADAIVRQLARRLPPADDGGAR